MTAPTAARVPAGIDPATAQFGTTTRGARAGLVYGETLDGRFAVKRNGRTWTVIRLADGEHLPLVPSLKAALAGIASGYADRELNRWKARREQRTAVAS